MLSVRLAKRTRYALYATMEMARDASRLVTVSEVASKYNIPETALAKVFQQLARSGLAVGLRGVGGGYRLARDASAVTVLEVMALYDPPRAVDVPCHLVAPARPSCTSPENCRLQRLFNEVDALARSTFGSVSLETLVR